jgi:hypothetical protein
MALRATKGKEDARSSGAGTLARGPAPSPVHRPQAGRGPHLQRSGLDQRREQVAFAQTAFDHGLDHTVSVPFAKSLDPVTKTNWEGTGAAGRESAGGRCSGNRRGAGDGEDSSEKRQQIADFFRNLEVS